MTKLRATLSGIALSGALLATAAAPALADSAPAGTTSHSVAAAVTKGQKLAKLKSLTDNTVASSQRWSDALTQHLQHKQAIEQYKFNWSTDYCSSSPDSLPGGYTFKWACYRHDFGYRNYKATVGNYYFRKDHKARIDKAFLSDMNGACNFKPWADPYPPAERKALKAACLRTAKKYYDAVVTVG